MLISAIVAMGANRVIGINNHLPWHLPLEFEHFKNKTLGHTLIMGRKSFESIGTPLPGRKTIILTRDASYEKEGCYICPNLEDALRKAHSLGEGEVFITGGGKVYGLSLPYLHRLYRTIVDFEGEGDVYFPNYLDYPWKIVESTHMDMGPNNERAWTYDLLVKEQDLSI